MVRGVVDNSGVVVARTRDPDRSLDRRDAGSFSSVTARRMGRLCDRTLEGVPVYGAYARAPMSRVVAGVPSRGSRCLVSAFTLIVSFFGITLLTLGLLAEPSRSRGGFHAISLEQTPGSADLIARGEHPGVPGRPVFGKSAACRMHLCAVHSTADARQRERDEQVARADGARAEPNMPDRGGTARLEAEKARTPPKKPQRQSVPGHCSP